MTTLTQRWGTPANVDTVGRSRALTGLAWTLQAAIAAMFVFAGGSKLAGAPMMVQTFDAIGIGQWFRYLTGSVEVIAAVLLLIPSLALYGAVLAALTMAGAVITHVAVLGGSPVAAIVLLAFATAVIWIRRSGR